MGIAAKSEEYDKIERFGYEEKKMEKGNSKQTWVLSILKILLFMYIVTGILLVILAGLLYKMQLSEGVVSAGIVVIYVLSGFLGGFLSGKIMKTRKFLWGMVMGACYFLILTVGSIAFQHGIDMELSRFFTTLVLCIGSGMIGGMAS